MRLVFSLISLTYYLEVKAIELEGMSEPLISAFWYCSNHAAQTFNKINKMCRKTKFCPYQKAFQALTALFHVRLCLFIFVSNQYWDLDLKSFAFPCSYSSDILKWFSQPEISQYSCYQISMAFPCAINFIITGTFKNRLFLFETLSTGFAFFLLCSLLSFHHSFTVTCKASLVKSWTLLYSFLH